MPSAFLLLLLVIPLSFHVQPCVAGPGDGPSCSAAGGHCLSFSATPLSPVLGESKHGGEDLGDPAGKHAQQAAGISASQVSSSSSPPRPHIVLFVFDDLGYNDLGTFSSPEAEAWSSPSEGSQQSQAPASYQPFTPHMDRLMAQGVKLKQFYVQPICSPTRSALMTGRYPVRTGGNVGVALPFHRTWAAAEEVFLPERLAQAGYVCRAVGKWHLGHSRRDFTPTGRGFHSFYGKYHGGGDFWEHVFYLEQNAMRPRPAEDDVDLHYDRWVGGRHVHTHILTENRTHSTDLFAREAERAVLEHDTSSGSSGGGGGGGGSGGGSGGGGGAPLFLYVPFQAPHWPTQFYQRHADLNAHIPGQKRREFAAMITQIDEAVGRVVAALQIRGMWDNTLVVAFADNGESVVVVVVVVVVLVEGGGRRRGEGGVLLVGGDGGASFLFPFS